MTMGRQLCLLFAVGMLFDNEAFALQVDRVGDAHRQLREGSSTRLTCKFDKGVSIVLNYEVSWIHLPLITDNEREVVLSKGDALSNGISSNHYAVEFTYTGSESVLSLDLKNAASYMDGKYICRAAPFSGGAPTQEEMEVLVPSDVIIVQLDFDGQQVTSVSSASVLAAVGQYTPTCRARGFHPAEASVSLSFDDQPLQTGSLRVTKDAALAAAARARRFQTVASSKGLQLSVSDTGKTLKCVATAVFQGATEKVASFPLEIAEMTVISTQGASVSTAGTGTSVSTPGTRTVWVSTSAAEENTTESIASPAGHSSEQSTTVGVLGALLFFTLAAGIGYFLWRRIQWKKDQGLEAPKPLASVAEEGLKDPAAKSTEQEIKDPATKAAEEEIKDPAAKSAEQEFKDPAAKAAEEEIKDPAANSAEQEIKDPAAKSAEEDVKEAGPAPKSPRSSVSGKTQHRKPSLSHKAKKK